MLEYFKKFMKVALIFDWELYMFCRHMLVYFNFDILLKIILVFSWFLFHIKINLARTEDDCWQSHYFFNPVKGISWFTARGREGLSGLFLQVFEGVSNLRRKGLTVNPQFMTKKPLPTKLLVLRFSGRTTGSELPGFGWFSWWVTLRSEMSLWFRPLKPIVWLLARLFGRTDVVLGPTPGYRPRPEEVPASPLSYKSSQVLVREKAALCRYQHGRGDPL